MVVPFCLVARTLTKARLEMRAEVSARPVLSEGCVSGRPAPARDDHPFSVTFFVLAFHTVNAQQSGGKRL